MEVTTQGHHKTINLLRSRLMGANIYKGQRKTYFNFIVLLAWFKMNISRYHEEHN